MQKAIFLDVDGTLVNEHGVAPNSARLAVQKARENGHLVFICTGRSKAEIFPEILDIGFDGMIGAAGGYIEIDGEVLFHERVKKADLEHLVAFFNKHRIDFKLESNEGVFAGGNMKRRLTEIIDHLYIENPNAKDEIKNGLQVFRDILIEGEDLIREDINKISFLGSELPFEMIKQEFESKFTIIPSTVSMFGENSGELSIPGINKATAINILLQHLQISRENTFAYGDSLNDIEMLEFVQHGIAMGNAVEAVKNVADDITDPIYEDGIYHSFKKYGLI